MWRKKNDCWLWWAIDRASKCVLGWTLGDRGTDTAERLDAQLPHAHLIFATDFWHPSAKIFRQANHVQGKAHTFTIESLNNRIRCYLARLKRRTHNYSQVQGKSRRQLLVLPHQEMRRRTRPRTSIHTYLAIPKIKAWEYDKFSPTDNEWRVLGAILPVKTILNAES